MFFTVDDVCKNVSFQYWLMLYFLGGFFQVHLQICINQVTIVGFLLQCFIINRRFQNRFYYSANIVFWRLMMEMLLQIAQMSTTIGILKGELSNRESPQLQESLAAERQMTQDVSKERDNLLRDNLDLKRQVCSWSHLAYKYVEVISW